jgi:NAD(P)-dependent dehydrogenase (short-subunit alcohol dehydrogenase family)
MRLDGKVAIITGAGSGIGLATTCCFHEAGASIVAADVSPDRLAQFANTDGIATVVADVSQRSDVDRMVATAVDRFGRLDVLCNDAGIMDRFLPVAEVTDEVWSHVLAVNLTGPMMASRAAIPRMLQAGGGVIINIASVGGVVGGRAGAAYTASKHGLIGLTRNVAATYGRDGIRCVAVCPGAVETGIPIGGEPSPRGYETLNRTLPAMPRGAQPIEIASICLFLASADAGFINGAAIVADAGWTAV